jgi:serine/threonine protein kinase
VKSSLTCQRHPVADRRDGFCAACLFEDALAPADQDIASPQLTIQVPLGRTASTSVFLVKSDGPPLRLLRLKTWRRPAPPGFLAGFRALQQQLESWGSEQLDRLVAVRIDKQGCPSVLSEFRPGMPILDRVRSGRLDPDTAMARLHSLAATIQKAHARGLAHGSLVPGNIIVDAQSGQVRLVDFGLTPLMRTNQDALTLAADDLSKLAALTDRILRPSAV